MFIFTITQAKKLKELKDEVGMAVSKNTQTRFVGMMIMYHIHYRADPEPPIGGAKLNNRA